MRRAITSTAWILMAMTVFVMLNCSEEDNPVNTTPGKTVIMPLKVGNTWTYIDTAIAGNSGPIVFPSRMYVKGTTVVEVDTVLYDAYIFIRTDSLLADSTQYYLNNDYLNNDEINGVWNYGIVCGTDSMLYKQMDMKYPVQVGDHFPKAYTICGPSSFSGFGHGTAVCTHTDTSYTTPAGTFSCVLYHETYNAPLIGETHVLTFAAPNVGMVAQEITSSLIIWKKVLTSYDLR